MSFKNFKKIEKSSAIAIEFDPKKCPANGCPLRATVSLGGMPFACSIHAFTESDKWPMLTEKIHDNRWVFDFIDNVQSMDQKCQDWRGFATKFWQGVDDYGMPVAREEAIPYQNRMRGEALWRLGEMKKRPAPKPLKTVEKPSGFFSKTTQFETA